MTDNLNALPAGFRLEQYEIVRLLGAGGFGLTYLGFDNKLDRPVAIKEYLPNDLAVRSENNSVLPKSTGDRGDYNWGLERFLDEARTLARFNHRNIIGVSGYHEAHGTAYIIMEYAEGDTLSDYLSRMGRLDQDQLTRLMMPILDGLEEVHNADFLHRDIKPGNIIIRDDGSPVLIDFGAARQAVGAKSRSVTSIVTPGYAPIEQYDTKGNQGPWTDIYALGAVAYKALTGKQPDDATGRIRRDPMVPAVDAGKGQANHAFLSAVDAALEVDEEDRPQTIGAWRDMLRGFDESAVVDTQRIEANSQTSVQNPMPEAVPAQPSGSGKGKMIAALLGLAVIGAGGWFGYSEYQLQQETIKLEAEAKASESRAWAQAKREDSIAAYQAYLRNWPTGANVSNAESALSAKQEQARIAALSAAERQQEKVRSAQRLLSALGYTIAVNGQADARTTAVVRQFERSQSLPELGVVDDTLLLALIKERDRRDDAAFVAAQSGGQISDYVEYRRAWPTGRHIAKLDDLAWARAQSVGTAAALDVYAQAFPSGAHIGEIAGLKRRIVADAQRRRDDQAWATATRAGTAAALDRYARSYPRGRHISKIAGLKSQYAADAAAKERQRLATLRTKGHKFKDCTNCPQMVTVPAGSFRMGSPSSEVSRHSNEGPQHTVRFQRPFAIGVYEVTFDEWDACVSAGGCKGYRPKDEGWGRGKRPVLHISYAQAKDYTSWLSRITGETYRLPTEAEWEYAARAGSRTVFSWGNAITKNNANYASNVAYNGGATSTSRSKTLPVGQLRPNAFGLYDVSGNVFERVQDCLHNSYTNAPTNGRAWMSENSGICEKYMARGGSWAGDPKYTRSASRVADPVAAANKYTGFRVVRELR